MYRYFAYAACLFMCVICILSLLRTRKTPLCQKFKKLEDGLAGLVSLADKLYIPLLLLLFAVFLFSRLALLDIVPAGIHMDELGMAYDAKCLAEYGTDRHGIRYPFYLQAYGGGQSALYAYLASICIRIFGYSVKVIRYPAVICAIPCFFASYFLIKELFESKRWALLGPVMVTITPYFMMSERWALDCNLFLSFVTVALYFYYKAVKSEKMRYYIIAGLVFGITLYTYVISYLVLTLFLVFSTLYLIYIRKFDLKKTIALAVPFTVLALPLLLMQLINMGICLEFSFLFSDFKKLGWYRGGEFSAANIIKNLSYTGVLLFGGEWLTYNSFYEYGPIYLFSVPLLFYGFIISVKDTWNSFRKRQFDSSVFLIFFTFLAWFIFMLITDLNMYKANEIFLPFILFIIIGIKNISDHMGAAAPVIFACFAAAFLSFSNFYFRYQNVEYGMHPLFISTELGDLIAYEEPLYNSAGKKVYIQRAYEHQTASDLIVGLYGNVEPKDWTQDGITQGHFEQRLPEDIDPGENAVYIIGHNWDFIISYMISEWGFQADNTYPSYTILYR